MCIRWAAGGSLVVAKIGPGSTIEAQKPNDKEPNGVARAGIVLRASFSKLFTKPEDAPAPSTLTMDSQSFAHYG